MGIFPATILPSPMNSIFTVHSAHECDIFVSASAAHKFFEIWEVLSEAVKGKTLFEQPSVRDERAGGLKVLEPDVIDVIKIDIKSFLDKSG